MSTVRIRLGSLLVAGLVLGVLVAMGWGHSQTGPSYAQTPTGALAVDCDTSQAGVQSACTYAPGSNFMVQVHVTDPSTDGFGAFQTLTQWDAAVVSYVPAAASADEALWADCSFAVRFPEPPTGDPPQLFGCAPFPLPNAGSTFTGAVVEFEFQCNAAPNASSPPAGLNADQTLIELVPGDPDGSYLTTLIGNALDTDLSNATVTCGDVPAPGDPTATPDAGAAPTAVIPDDLPTTGASLLDGNGGVNGGLWAVIGILLAAAAAITGVAWKRTRAR